MFLVGETNFCGFLSPQEFRRGRYRKGFPANRLCLGFGAGAAKGLPNGFCAASEAVEAGKMLGIVTKFDFLQAFALTTVKLCPISMS